MRGFGQYIRSAREAAGYTPEDLAERLGRTKSTIYRIEDEETEPSVEQINALVAALPISAEELLRKMGVSLAPPATARIPRTLAVALLALSPDDLLVVERLALGLQRAPGGRRESPP